MMIWKHHLKLLPNTVVQQRRLSSLASKVPSLSRDSKGLSSNYCSTPTTQIPTSRIDFDCCPTKDSKKKKGLWWKLYCKTLVLGGAYICLLLAFISQSSLWKHAITQLSIHNCKKQEVGHCHPNFKNENWPRDFKRDLSSWLKYEPHYIGIPKQQL